MVETGIAAEIRGDAGEAERLFREAVATDPQSAFAQMNLGIALQGRGDIHGAAAAHAEAVRIDPLLANAHYNLARVRLDLNDFAQSEGGFRDALRLRPEFPEAWVGLADALESTGRDQEALDALATAITLREHYVGALFNSAVLLRKLGRLDEAEARLRGVPSEHPEYANAMTALAATLRDLGRADEAVEASRAALKRAPDAGAAQDELLFTLSLSDTLTTEALFTQHVEAGRRVEAATRPWCRNFSNPPDPDRILNIGYLSSDFSRRHSVASFIEFLFERHRRNRVRIFAYSSTLQHDAMTAKYVSTADAWRDLRGRVDAQAAAAILDDRIDILVDLNGRTSPSRIGILAGRAAPVQMTWLGYIGTTGLTRVDFRITDPVADPPGTAEALHTERLLRMPHSQWCFRPSETALNTAVERDAALRPFTFGALNQFAKVTDASIALWIAVMRANTAARMRVVGVPRGSATETLVRRLAGADIDRARYDLVERVPLAEYYREYGRVDACLDTTPYSGGTTTCDALWMGVPAVTLSGTRSVSRSTASLLTTLGRSDLVARSSNEFVAIASRLAAQGEWPTSARAALRERFIASPLMDEQRFTEDLEALYRKAWYEWCGGSRTATVPEVRSVV